MKKKYSNGKVQQELEYEMQNMHSKLECCTFTRRKLYWASMRVFTNCQDRFWPNSAEYSLTRHSRKIPILALYVEKLVTAKQLV